MKPIPLLQLGGWGQGETTSSSWKLQRSLFFPELVCKVVVSELNFKKKGERGQVACFYSRIIMGFPFVSIWAEIKGRIELCCANFWFLLHFALPQSGKYRCGSSVTPVQVLPVVYLGDCSVQLPGMYRCREGLWKPPCEMCVWASLWLEITLSSRCEYLGRFLKPFLEPHP